MRRRVGAACCPDKVGPSGCALHWASEELVILGVGHTVSSAGRRPRASLQQAVRTLSVGMEVFTPSNNSPSKICLKLLQWRRSIGQVQIFIYKSILLRSEYHAHLQRSSVEMNRESMSLIEKWKLFPLEWIRNWWWKY